MRNGHKLAVVNINRARQASWSDDVREIPIYTITDVAHYLRMHPNTLYSWTLPKVEMGKKRENFRPLINVNKSYTSEWMLSFFNVLEAHTLLAALRYHHLPILTVRRAIELVYDDMPSSRHPLAEYTFKTKGKHLFVEQLLSAKKRVTDYIGHRQTVLVDVLDTYLDRITRDQSGLPIRLFPVKPGATPDPSQPVMMDLDFASGSLVVADTGIRAAVLRGRYKAGHTLERLSRDYHLSVEKIKGAIDYLEAAA